MSFDFDLFVIGAGSGGVRAARFAAGFGARVAVAESRYLGGTCVNVGCVPKKMLVYGAHYSEDLEQAHAYGWSAGAPAFDWPTLIAHKNTEIARLNEVYRGLLVQSGVRLIEGHARLVDPHTVEINGERISAAHILLATGTWPSVPDIPGKDHAITSNEAFYLEALPRRATVIGGGYIAVEFASIFNGLGAQTTQICRGDQILRGFDRGIRQHLKEELAKKGIDLRLKSQVTRIDKQADGSLALTLDDGSTLETDLVMFATGREARLEDLGLENTRVALDERGFIRVDDNYVTTEPSILALGDVIGRVQLTPVATAEGMAVARRLFKPEQYRPVDYRQIPTAVFSLPAIGTVGLTEDEALLDGHNITVYESRFGTLRLALTDSKEKTLMRLIVDADTDKVLGVHMVGADAGEIIQGMAIALKAGATKRVFDDTIGIHPTSAEEFVTMRTPVPA
jgi:glutathione reductase (NADPH)